MKATGGSNATGIGGGTNSNGDLVGPGSFSTGADGNAVIFASSSTGTTHIQDNDDTSGWNGVIFQGDTDGTIYGTSVTPGEDFSVPDGKTLTIDSGKTLIIPEGVILANKGTITNNGEIIVYGTLEGSGSIEGSGTFPVTGVTLDKTSLTLTVGGTGTLTAAVQPSSASNKTLTWSSDNEAIATVDDSGKVTAVGAGTAVITATAADGSGKSASCTVTVTEPYVPPVTPEEDNSDPTYSVSWPRTVEGGRVTVKKSYAEEGETFSFTVIPDEGWELDTLAVTDSRGRALDLTGKGGEYSFEMPARAVEMEISFRKIAVEPEKLPFTDVPENAWYAEAVGYVYENGLMAGVNDTAFGPDVTTSRSMIAAILWRMAGSPVVNYALTYTDVPQGQWYSEAVRWAASEGIVSGYGDTFGTDDPITREQLAVMLYRMAQKEGLGFTEAWAFRLDYADANEVSDYAYEALCWTTMHGIITGTGDGSTLSPRARPPGPRRR